MMKAHCDNCDDLIIRDVANPSRLVTVQPMGFQCVVTVTIRKREDLELCARCLRAAVLAFAESLLPTPSVERATPLRARDDEIRAHVATSPSDLVSWGDTRE